MPSGYIKSTNGDRIEIVDATARAGMIKHINEDGTMTVEEFMSLDNGVYYIQNSIEVTFITDDPNTTGTVTTDVTGLVEKGDDWLTDFGYIGLYDYNEEYCGFYDYLLQMTPSDVDELIDVKLQALDGTGDEF